jgi:uncharacterized small protein (DUF1192 family)
MTQRPKPRIQPSRKAPGHSPTNRFRSFERGPARSSSRPNSTSCERVDHLGLLSAIELEERKDTLRRETDGLTAKLACGAVG